MSARSRPGWRADEPSRHPGGERRRPGERRLAGPTRHQRPAGRGLRRPPAAGRLRRTSGHRAPTGPIARTDPTTPPDRRPARAERDARAARAERKSSTGRPVHGKGTPRTSDAQPGNGSGASAPATGSASDSAGSPASDPRTGTGTEPADATSGAAGGPVPATDITVNPLATPAPGAAADSAATAGASSQTPAATSADAVSSSTPPWPPRERSRARSTELPVRPGRWVWRGHSSVTGNLAGGRLDGRRGATRAGDAGPVATTGAPVDRELPARPRGLGRRVGRRRRRDRLRHRSGGRARRGRRCRLGRWPSRRVIRPRCFMGSAGQNPGVPTVSAISNVAAAAPVAGSLATGPSQPRRTPGERGRPAGREPADPA